AVDKPESAAIANGKESKGSNAFNRSHRSGDRGIRRAARRQEPGSGPVGKEGRTGASEEARGQTPEGDRPEGCGGKVEKVGTYSCRSAWMGSTRLARMAGNHTAASATTTNMTGTTKKTSGSHGFTP